MAPTQLIVATLVVAVMCQISPALAEPTTSPMKQAQIVGHRGESHDAPENTLASMNLAWKRDADGVEMDLHLTSDGKLITSHDKETFRITGGETGGGVKMVIAEHTAAELQKLDVGKWKGPQFAGEHMPLIDEVLATIPHEKGKRLFIEVKVGPEAAAPLVAAIHNAGYPAEQTVVISFKLDSCQEVKKAMPELKVYYLSDFKIDKQTGAMTPTIDELIKTTKDAGLDGIDVAFKGPIDAASVKRVHDAGLEFYVWTVDDPEVAKRLIDAGVDGVTTNRAQWLRGQLQPDTKTSHK